MRTRRRGRQSVSGSVFVVSLGDTATVFEQDVGQVSILTLPVARTGNIGFTGRVQWGIHFLIDNPATLADFGGTYQGGTVEFAENQLSSNIEISISGNDEIDGNRNFVVSLNAPETDGGSNLAAIGKQSMICTIIDDDAPLPTTMVTYNGNDAYYNGDPVEL